MNKKIKRYRKLVEELLKSDSYSLRELHDDYLNRIKHMQHKVRGVYAIFDKKNGLIYVGKTRTRTVLDRVGNQHIYGGAPSDLRDILGRPPIERLYEYTCKYLEVSETMERSRFEQFAIAILNPKLNK